MKTKMKLIITVGIVLILGFEYLSGQTVDNNSSVKTLLERPLGRLFYIERINGEYKMGDTTSHFNNNKNFDDLTFDISNNKVLANVSLRGSVKNLTFYRDSYFANCSQVAEVTKRSWPGVWAAKDNSSYGPYNFSIEINGEKHNLDSVNWDFKTGLLDNIIPITEYKGPNGEFIIKLVTFAPVSNDGSQRIRGAIYGLYLENLSGKNIKGKVNLPRLMTGNRKDLSLMSTGAVSWANLDPYDFELALGDSRENKYEVEFDLNKGENIWVPAVFYNLGETALAEINKIGSLQCLNNTLSYFRNMLGRIETPEDPFLAEFFQRQVMASFGAIAMSPLGKVAGSNWGSYPATRQIWLKDFYYTSLPFTILDRELAQKIIFWFSEFGVRPKGNVLEGGVNHSVGISMASLMLAGLYYEHSGDKQFFIQNKKLRNHWEQILSELISSRRDSDIWLFPSSYISDGYIIPDYHTGSNVCAWFALKSYSRILKEVYNEPETAGRYDTIASRVHSAIMERCTINGPFGKQFIEATYRDGRSAPMESDGEESDITLMPLYGFLSWDDSVYLNYMKFSVSEYNTIYRPSIHAISWYITPSTAPGYMKGVCAGTDKASLFGEHGYLTEIRRVTDADGSIWWWVYGWGEKGVTPPYGKVVRGNPGGFGKAGWFSGIYSTVYIVRQMGISFNKSVNSLIFRPLMPSSGFEWNNFDIQGNRFSVNYSFDSQEEAVSIMNNNPESVKLEVSLPVATLKKGYKAFLNGKLFTESKSGKYLNQDYTILSLEARGKQEVKIRLLPKGK